MTALHMQKTTEAAIKPGLKRPSAPDPEPRFDEQVRLDAERMGLSTEEYASLLRQKRGSLFAGK